MEVLKKVIPRKTIKVERGGEEEEMEGGEKRGRGSGTEEGVRSKVKTYPRKTINSG